MTNPIGTGTCNLTINVPLDERAELGRLAFSAGAKSVGDFLRELLLSGLQARDTDAAMRVKVIRQRYYGTALLALFIGFMLLADAADLRRSNRRVRTIREEEICS